VSPGGAAEDGKCCRVGRAHTSRQSFPTALSSELSSLPFPSPVSIAVVVPAWSGAGRLLV
jgi:hypothetical protein